MTNKFIYLLKKSFAFRFLMFMLAITLISSIILYLSWITSTTPVITSIEPKIAEKDASIIISGKHFGDTYAASWIQIGDAIIQSESCELWTDTKIIFKYPESQNENLLRVVVQNRKSNHTFLANKNEIPIVKEKALASAPPIVSKLSKTASEVGSVIKISGQNFGNTRGNAQVLFVPNSSTTLIPQLKLGEDIGAAACSEHDFDFIYWADDELRIRVPDGADTGMVIVKTDGGISEPTPFRVRNKIGTKTNSNKKAILLASEVSVSDCKAKGQNSFFIKVPLPIQSFSQKGLEIISVMPTPFVQNYNDSTIHRYENIESGKKISIRQEYNIDSYELNTRINPINIRINSRKNTGVYKKYTASTALIPTQDPVIKETLYKIIGRERNPYHKARKIYNYFLTQMEIIPTSTLNSGNAPVDALTKKTADTYDAVILFTALARACGIPAEPMAGIVIDSNQKSYLHWWAQFYIEGFGWVPVDIGMAKGIPFDIGIPQKERYYFGNLDAFRVAFSYGEKVHTSMTSNSKSTTKDRSYAFSDSWEEFSGEIEYKSTWKIPEVVSIY